MPKAVRRSRAELLAPLQATTRAELPNLYGRFLMPSKEDVLKWDSAFINRDGENRLSQDRILLFPTDANLDTLAISDHWFPDGTFTSQPLLFDQPFVIYGLQMDAANVLCVPLVYCLTPNCTTSTYSKVLQKLKELRPALAPISEQALQKSFTTTLPNVEYRGCFFHFRQANYRHI
jgi:hypothetical protein